MTWTVLPAYAGVIALERGAPGMWPAAYDVLIARVVREVATAFESFDPVPHWRGRASGALLRNAYADIGVTLAGEQALIWMALRADREFCIRAIRPDLRPSAVNWLAGASGRFDSVLTQLGCAPAYHLLPGTPAFTAFASHAATPAAPRLPLAA